MNPRISYIIATYAGKDHTSNGVLSEYVLSIQMGQVLKYVQHYSSIHEIIIMYPPTSPTNTFQHYYNRDWIETFKEYDVTVRFIEYKGDNQYHSYDQWIQGFQHANPQSNYFVFVEDDYFMDPTHDSINALVTTYQRKFKNNIGYLGTLVGYGGHDVLHGRISNGMISRSTMDTFDNMLMDFYSPELKYKFGQLRFSELFVRHCIPQEDYSDEYGIYFWQSSAQHLWDFTQSSAKEKKSQLHIFIPIQYLISPYPSRIGV